MSEPVSDSGRTVHIHTDPNASPSGNSKETVEMMPVVPGSEGVHAVAPAHLPSPHKDGEDVDEHYLKEMVSNSNTEWHTESSVWQLGSLAPCTCTFLCSALLQGYKQELMRGFDAFMVRVHLPHHESSGTLLRRSHVALLFLCFLLRPSRSA
jgi:hypothetical protein